MYRPQAFSEDDRTALHGLIRTHAFGTLVTTGTDGPFASHVPFLLEPGSEEGTGRDRLLFHLARPNPQVGQLAAGTDALAIFQGPHGYVSPSWYAERSKAVPTWNYAVVHARGRARIIEETAAIDRLLERLSAVFETAIPQPWSPAELAARQREGLRNGIVAFELAVERLEGKFKLSQNRSQTDRRGVVEGLRACGDAGSLALAEMMEIPEDGAGP